MISNQTIKQSLTRLSAITRVDFAVYDTEGSIIASTWEANDDFKETVIQFAESPADRQEVQGYHYFKAKDEDDNELILIARGSGDDVHTLGRVAASQLAELMNAYRDRYDRNSFIQNLLLDNLLLVDICNRARKLHIEVERRRLVYIVESEAVKDDTGRQVLKGLFAGSGKDHITQVDEHSIILVQELAANEGYAFAEQTAMTICDMMNMEAMAGARVSYGTIVTELSQVSRSYKEAKMAMEVGKIFYMEKKIHAYNTLGIGRLIYQLPVNLCEMFMNEVFVLQKPDTFDEETLTTINKFFENNRNVSETARQLFVHRNTRVYRLERLQKATGLDIRVFEDALTFKIALMVVNYMRHIRGEGTFSY